MVLRFIITESQLKEALKPSQFRDYVKLWKQVGGDKIKDEWFGNKHRIEIPYEEEEIETHEQKIVKYVLERNGYIVSDYKKGIVYKNNRPIRIGKVLNRLNPGIKKIYDEDPSRSLSKKSEFKIILSRHAYDIAGQSTDRSWRSCKALGYDQYANEGWPMDYDIEHDKYYHEYAYNDTRGVYAHYVMYDVKEKALIAYLVKENDTNIRNPIARVLINPYIGTNNNIVFYYPASTVYPKNYGGFYDSVMEWLMEKQKHLPFDMYKLNCMIYDDGNDTLIRAGDESSIDKLDAILETGDIESAYTYFLSLTEPEKKFISDKKCRINFNEKELTVIPKLINYSSQYIDKGFFRYILKNNENYHDFLNLSISFIDSLKVLMYIGVPYIKAFEISYSKNKDIPKFSELLKNFSTVIEYPHVYYSFEEYYVLLYDTSTPFTERRRQYNIAIEGYDELEEKFNYYNRFKSKTIKIFNDIVENSGNIYHNIQFLVDKLVEIIELNLTQSEYDLLSDEAKDYINENAIV